MLDIKEIQKLLPHRYPFLLIDRVIELEPGKRAVAIKNVTANEPQFAGHWPEDPVMPGVLILEAMAQAGGVMLLSSESFSDKLAVFGGMDKVRFRRQVIPGDQVRIEATLLRRKGTIGKVHVLATVDGEKAAEGELVFALTDRE